MKEIWLGMCFAGLLFGCAERNVQVERPESEVSDEQGDESEDVADPDDEPPAPEVEAQPPSPGPTYVWIGGHHRWAGRWIWVRGHYRIGRPGHVWVPGRWHRRHHRMVWVHGRWHR